MSENKTSKRKPDPQKMAVLRSLPVEIKQSLTGEEVNCFLYEENCPESLWEKLKDYVQVDNESEKRI